MLDAKSLRTSLLALPLLFLLTQCNTFTSYKAEVSTVDSLLTEVKKMEERFNNLDFTTISTVKETVFLELDSVTNICKNNDVALTKEEAIFFGRYKGITKPVKKVDKDRGMLIHELEFTQKQLGNLKTDLDKKALSKEEAAKFIADEKMAVKTLEKSISNLERGSDILLTKFKQMRGEVNGHFKTILERAEK